MFANTQMMGMDLAFPDICLTPMPLPVPIPYPNIALGPIGIPPAIKILFFACPAHNIATIVPLTLGDQPGVLGGIMTGTFMFPSWHIGFFSVTTLLMGIPATRMLSLTTQNLWNSKGIRLVPSQVKVLILAA